MSLTALLANHEDVSNVLIPDHLKNAPKNVRDRARALKKLQLKTVEVQAEFYKRVHALETEFRPRFDEVNKKRELIVSGKHEPAENECDAKLFSWMDDDQEKKFNETAQAAGDQKGIPDFWLNVLRSVPAVAELITEADEEILRHLTDITVEQTNEPPAFTLNFHFSENAFFTNTALSKYYKLSIGPNGLETEVLYDGPSIVSTKGCKISWKEGKDITKKTIKKKPKKGGQAVTKVVPAESFFRFFTPEVEQVEKDLPEESAEMLNADFEAGQMIRDSVVDSAILYYTGESIEDEDYGYDAEDEDEHFGGVDESGDDEE